MNYTVLHLHVHCTGIRFVRPSEVLHFQYIVYHCIVYCIYYIVLIYSNNFIVKQNSKTCVNDNHSISKQANKLFFSTFENNGLKRYYSLL